MGKKQIDYSEYEEFINTFYSNKYNSSFDTIKQFFYDDTSYVRVDVYNSKLKDTMQMMVFEDSEKQEIDQLNKFLKSMGNVYAREMTYESVENIYDVPVPDLYCFGFNVKYVNFETNESFWLKKKENKICIYSYSTGRTIDE